MTTPSSRPASARCDDQRRPRGDRGAAGVQRDRLRSRSTPRPADAARRTSSTRSRASPAASRPARARPRTTCVVEGGVRIRGIAVASVVSDGQRADRHRRPGRRLLDVQRCAWSPRPRATEPPAGFDPALAAVAFSFKVACPTTFDCRGPADDVRRAASPRADRLPRQGLRQLPPPRRRPARAHAAGLARPQPRRRAGRRCSSCSPTSPTS